MYEVAPSILESRLLGSTNIVDAAVVGIPDKENGEVRKKAGKFKFKKIIIILSFDPFFTNFKQVPRAFVVLRPGFEETEENITNIMESRLQDHERIRGGLFFIQNIPRDENWKVRRDILAAYDPNKTIHNNSNNETGESDKVVQELNRQPNGTFVGMVYIKSPLDNALNYYLVWCVIQKSIHLVIAWLALDKKISRK